MIKTLSISAILIALAAVPTASADGCTDLAGNGAVCTYDYNYAWGSCDNGYAFGVTEVVVYTNDAFVDAYGYSYCGGYPGYYNYEGGGAQAFAYTSATGYTFVYTYSYEYSFFGQEYSYCDTGVYTDATGGASVGCPVGPLPNPGWGSLLP